MESPCLFTRQQSLLLETHEILPWNKVYFIQISGIASFKPFFIDWLWRYFTSFRESSVVSSKSSPWPKYTKYGTIFPKKVMFYNQTFFLFSNMFFIRLFLANNWKESRGSQCLFPHKLPWKVDMVSRSQSGCNRRYQIPRNEVNQDLMRFWSY